MNNRELKREIVELRALQRIVVDVREFFHCIFLYSVYIHMTVFKFFYYWRTI